jgi:hypothetical protein
MNGNHQNEIIHIRPEMTILEIVHKYKLTQEVFKKYGEEKGQCIMCTALFESLKTVSERFGLNLEKLLEELEAAAG